MPPTPSSPTSPPPATATCRRSRASSRQPAGGEDWIRERELTHEQAFALGFLEQNPGSIQRDIAALTRTSAASVSSLLQGLERRGLIERRTENGNERSKRVYAASAGAELIAGFDSAMEAADDTILAPLSAAERATLHALLKKVTAVLPQPSR
ncbi:MarR family transcriptional regulator [Subtercola boreus]|uniref:MarR family transcriptional regulator n=1 Tax=Subtercola boreus TaxID=120213 RepID=A0A3E0VQA3_9MICO|nr:MarR family transcriptional regulator [Subtercola boreus]